MKFALPLAGINEQSLKNYSKTYSVGREQAKLVHNTLSVILVFMTLGTVKQQQKGFGHTACCPYESNLRGISENSNSVLQGL